MANNAGLLFVYGETGPDVTEHDFNDWYDTEHAPARIAIPNISTATRYKAHDGTKPSYLALYDTTVPNIYQDEGYKSLAGKGSTNEKSLVPRLSLLDRRLYNPIPIPNSVQQPATFDPEAVKFILIAGLQPKSENEDDLNNWYNEEHLGLLLKVPGCLRARRFKLVDQVELARGILERPGSSTSGPDANEKGLVAHPYLALYDFDNDKFLTSPEFAKAVGTVWSKEILGGVLSSEMRVFGVHKIFSK